MLGQRLSHVGITSLTGLLLLAAPAMVRAVDISDKGEFFSATAVEKANAAIRKIEKESGREIRIETHATVPSSKVDAVEKMDKHEREKFMSDWVNERAKETKENGFLMLICKHPGRVETWMSRKIKDAGLSDDDRKMLTDTMLDGLKSKKNDEALDHTVNKFAEVYAKLKVNHSQPATVPLERSTNKPIIPHRVGQAPVQANWTPVLYVIGFVFLAIFGISMLSRLFGGGNRGYSGAGGGFGQPGSGPPPPPGYGPPGGGYGPGYGGGGGGGFMRSLAGGMFGAVAGNWLYNSFGGGHSAHAHDSTMANSDPLSGSQTLEEAIKTDERPKSMTIGED